MDEQGIISDAEMSALNVNKEGIEYLKELRPYIVLENSPKTKKLKSQNGPDIHSGDMGDPVVLETSYGWVMNYHLPKDDACAKIEAGRGLSEKSSLSTTQVEVQTFESAVEIIDFLSSQGWKSFTYVEGTNALSWSVWAYLNFRGIELEGYEVDDAGEGKFKQSWHLFDGVSKLQHETKPAMGSLMGPRGATSFVEVGEDALTELESDDSDA